jgi:hypothetical protein
MAFADKLEVSRKELIWLVTGTDMGKPCWYYVQVEKSKLELFKGMAKTPQIPLLDYGKILYSGWGSQPPEHIKKKVLSAE